MLMLKHMKRVNTNIDQMHMFVTISKGGMKINGDANAKN